MYQSRLHSSLGTSSSSHTDYGIHAMADGNIPEPLQAKEPGDCQLSYQAMMIVKFRFVPWALSLQDPGLRRTKGESNLGQHNECIRFKQWI